MYLNKGFRIKFGILCFLLLTNCFLGIYSVLINFLFISIIGRNKRGAHLFKLFNDFINKGFIQ